MKTVFFLFLLSAVFFILPAPGKSADVAHPELPRITAEEFKQVMDKKGEYVLVDSGNAASYNEAHIEGAINIHYDPSGDPMARKMTLMALPMDQLIIVYCASEDENISAGLTLELFDMGYDMNLIKILSGGVLHWRASGFPLVSAGE